MRENLKGHRAVVTGASSGIGKEYARQLAEMGSDLVIAARRLDRLEELAKELRAAYSIKVECIQIDLSQPGAAKALFEAATKTSKPKTKTETETEETAPITILINNAGLARYGTFIDFPYEDHHDTIQVNTVAPTETTHYFVKHMLKHGKKSYITQVASIAAFQPVGNFSVYSGTKGYMMYFSESLAFELRKSNVSVMCLCPGGTYTEFFAHSGQKITSTGHMTMMSAQEVVRTAINAMLRGNTIYVPGFLNKLACFFPRFLPRSLGIYLAAKTMGRAVEKVTPERIT